MLYNLIYPQERYTGIQTELHWYTFCAIPIFYFFIVCDFSRSHMTGKDYHNFIFVLLRHFGREKKLPPAVKLNCEHALKIFICRHFDTQEAVTALAT